MRSIQMAFVRPTPGLYPHPPRRRRPFVPLYSHTHTHTVLTHISRFSLPPPSLPYPPPVLCCFPSHSATGELIWLLEHSGPIMNELREICTFKGKGKDEEEEMHNTRGISEAIPELNQFYISVGFFPSIKNAVRFQYG